MGSGKANELDSHFERIYEDNVMGKLSDERFTKMSGKYEQEHKDIRSEIAELKKVVLGQEV